jgi:hypothetical protein
VDPHRFDRLVRSFATLSRRRLLATIGGGLLALAKRDRQVLALQDAGPLTPPLPNFPYLAALPTDRGLPGYGVELRNGGPVRYATADSITYLTPALSSLLAPAFRGSYEASISLPSSADPTRSDRVISTFLVDAGSEDAARQLHADYSAVILSAAGAVSLGERPHVGMETTYIGCDGGCEAAIGDLGAYGSDT